MLNYFQGGQGNECVWSITPASDDLDGFDRIPCAGLATYRQVHSNKHDFGRKRDSDTQESRRPPARLYAPAPFVPLMFPYSPEGHTLITSGAYLPYAKGNLHMATWAVGIAGRCSEKFGDRIPTLARRRCFLWVMAVVHVWATVGTFGRADDPKVQLVSTELVGEMLGDGEPKLFSAAWAEEYRLAKPGCDLGRGSYVWRRHGFGSNMNSERKTQPESNLAFMHSTFWTGRNRPSLC